MHALTHEQWYHYLHFILLYNFVFFLARQANDRHVRVICSDPVPGVHAVDRSPGELEAATVRQQRRTEGMGLRMQVQRSSTSVSVTRTAHCVPRVRQRALASNARASAAAEPLQPGGRSSKYANLPEPLAKRMEADPNFLYKLLVEIGIDETTTAAVNILERGSPLAWTAQQMLQVISQAFNAALNDTALVWFLAPKAGESGKQQQQQQLPSHAFEPGSFSLTKRCLAVLQKAYLYSIIGAFTGILSLVPSFLILNKCMPALSHIGRAAAGGALALGVSANLR